MADIATEPAAHQAMDESTGNGAVNGVKETIHSCADDDSSVPHLENGGAHGEVGSVEKTKANVRVEVQNDASGEGEDSFESAQKRAKVLAAEAVEAQAAAQKADEAAADKLILAVEAANGVTEHLVGEKIVEIDENGEKHSEPEVPLDTVKPQVDKDALQTEEKTADVTESVEHGETEPTDKSTDHFLSHTSEQSVQDSNLGAAHPDTPAGEGDAASEKIGAGIDLFPVDVQEPLHSNGTGVQEVNDEYRTTVNQPLDQDPAPMQVE